MEGGGERLFALDLVSFEAACTSHDQHMDGQLNCLRWVIDTDVLKTTQWSAALAKAVKFPYSPILHYAFSSWIEKTMTKTIDCHWENRFVLQ